MGEQKNLTEENVEELRAVLDKMAEENHELEYRFFDQETDETKYAYGNEQPSNKKIFEKLEALERKIDLIFGTYKLLDGMWVKL